MTREVIAVCGKTGFGKSVWTRKYTASKKRLFVFDPLLTFPCQYLDEQTLIQKYDEGFFDEGMQFSVGSGNMDVLELLGALVMLSGNALLVVEECAISFDKYGRIPQWLRDIVFLGRHRNASILVTAQRAASVPVDLRSQISRLVTFQQSEGDDLQALKPFLGNDVKILPQLPVLECIDAGTYEKSRYSITP
jgi:DNA helicase HerA-like ATPase